MKLFKKLLSLCLAVLAVSVIWNVAPSEAQAARDRHITIVFDAEGIVEGDPGNHIFMCTRTQDAISDNCGAELNLSADNGDVIYFTWETVSAGEQYTVVLNRFPITSDPKATLIDRGYIGKKVIFNKYDNVPLGAPEITPNMLELDMVTVPSWEYEIDYPCESKIIYNGVYTIYDENGEQVGGQRSWDPYITINQGVHVPGC